MPSMRRGGPGHGARRQYDPDGRGTKSGKRYLGDKIKEHWQNAQQGLSMFNAIRTFSEGRLFVLDSGVLIVDFSWIVHRVAPMFAWELVQLAFGDENLDPLSAAQAEEIFTKLATGLMREIWKALAPTNRPLPTGYRVVIIHELTAESAKELLRKEGPGVSLPETTAELDELLSRHGDSCPLRPLPLLVPGYQGGAAVAALGSAVPTNGDAAPAEAANFNFLRKTDVERESRTRSSASAASKGIKRVLVVHGDGFKRTNKVVDPRKLPGAPQAATNVLLSDPMFKLCLFRATQKVFETPDMKDKLPAVVSHIVVGEFDPAAFAYARNVKAERAPNARPTFVGVLTVDTDFSAFNVGRYMDAMLDGIGKQKRLLPLDRVNQLFGGGCSPLVIAFAVAVGGTDNTLRYGMGPKAVIDLLDQLGLRKDYTERVPGQGPQELLDALPRGPQVPEEACCRVSREGWAGHRQGHQCVPEPVSKWTLAPAHARDRRRPAQTGSLCRLCRQGNACRGSFGSMGRGAPQASEAEASTSLQGDEGQYREVSSG